MAALKDESLLPSLLLIYIALFYDCGLSCPYTVSLSTAPVEVIERKQAHHMLIQYLQPANRMPELQETFAAIDVNESLPVGERERTWEALGTRLAHTTAAALLQQLQIR